MSKLVSLPTGVANPQVTESIRPTQKAVGLHPNDMAVFSATGANKAPADALERNSVRTQPKKQISNKAPKALDPHKCETPKAKRSAIPVTEMA